MASVEITLNNDTHHFLYWVVILQDAKNHNQHEQIFEGQIKKAPDGKTEGSQILPNKKQNLVPRKTLYKSKCVDHHMLEV